MISTTLGAEGLDVQTTVADLLLADEPDAFATAIVALVNEPRMASA